MKYLMLFAICLVCSFFVSTNAQKRCCFAKQYTQNYKQMVGQSIHGKGSLFVQDALFSFDATNKKQAWNGTTYIDGQGPYPWRVNWDYNKKVKYDIDPTKKTCQKSTLTDAMFTCIPPSAKFIGSGIVGDNTKVNGWSITGHPVWPQVTIFVTDPGCIMTSEAVVYTPHELTQMAAVSAFNYTKSVNPNAFTVPSYCPPPTKVDVE